MASKITAAVSELVTGAALAVYMLINLIWVSAFLLVVGTLLYCLGYAFVVVALDHFGINARSPTNDGGSLWKIIMR